MVCKSFLVYFFDVVKCNNLINLCNIFGVIGRWIFGVLDNCCVFFMSFLMMKNLVDQGVFEYDDDKRFLLNKCLQYYVIFFGYVFKL